MDFPNSSVGFNDLVLKLMLWKFWINSTLVSYRCWENNAKVYYVQGASDKEGLNFYFFVMSDF